MICFIIPIHPPDYKYVNNILNTKEKYKYNNLDIYFIFSNLQDKLIFDKKFKSLNIKYYTLNSNYSNFQKNMVPNINVNEPMTWLSPKSGAYEPFDAKFSPVVLRKYKLPAAR